MARGDVNIGFCFFHFSILMSPVTDSPSQGLSSCRLPMPRGLAPGDGKRKALSESRSKWISKVCVGVVDVTERKGERFGGVGTVEACMIA